MTMFAISPYNIVTGNECAVVTSSPEDAERVFRAEGQYPSRGTFESSMMWIYDSIDHPQSMIFS